MKEKYWIKLVHYDIKFLLIYENTFNEKKIVKSRLF